MCVNAKPRMADNCVDRDVCKEDFQGGDLHYVILLLIIFSLTIKKEEVGRGKRVDDDLGVQR